MKLQITVTALGGNVWRAEAPGAAFVGTDRGKVIDQVKRIIYAQFSTWEKPPSNVSFEVINE